MNGGVAIFTRTAQPQLLLATVVVEPWATENAA